MTYQYFIDEYPAAIEAAKQRCDSLRMDARRSPTAVPAYTAAKQFLAKLKYEYEMQKKVTP